MDDLGVPLLYETSILGCWLHIAWGFPWLLLVLPTFTKYDMMVSEVIGVPLVTILHFQRDSHSQNPSTWGFSHGFPTQMRTMVLEYLPNWVITLGFLCW